MFEADRTFYINNEKTGEIEWYFQAREGNAGPYASKQEAQLMLQEFFKECIEYGDTGVRKTKEAESISSTPKPVAQVIFNYQPKRRWY